MRKTLLAMMAVPVLALAACGGDDGGDDGDKPKATIPALEIGDLDAAVEAAGCELQNPKNEGSDHTEDPVTYKANPPTSGAHNPVAAEDGNYAGQEAPTVESTVHSLEHGRIDLQYKTGTPAATIAKLEVLYDEQDGYHTLLFENQTDMPYAVAATAWDHAVVCEKFSDKVFDALRAFREEYVDKGPELVP